MANGTTSTGSSATTSAACTGATYNVESGDTCASIAASQHTALWWLLLDNNLAANCANFPTNGSLCINHPCSTYAVQSGDTCTSVASNNNITVTQLQTWNPWIDSSCYNFNSTMGTLICVGQPGVSKYVTPTNVVGAPTTAISAVPVPTNVAPNTTHDCGKFYYVLPGDDCNHISIQFGISLSDLYILNPMINANCTNLYANTSYCVEPVGSINNYPGSPFYNIGNSSDTTAPAFSSYPNATYSPILPTRAASPLAPGTIANCSVYADGSDLIYGYPDNSDCNAAAFIYGVTAEELQSWNPSLSTNSTGCTFTSGFQYCSMCAAVLPLPKSTS